MIEETEQLFAQLEVQDMRRRQRNVLFTFIPLLLVGAFVTYGLVRVNDAHNEASELEKRTDSLRAVDSIYQLHVESRKSLLDDLDHDLTLASKRPDFGPALTHLVIAQYKKQDSELHSDLSNQLRDIR